MRTLWITAACLTLTSAMMGCKGSSADLEKLLNTQDDHELCDKLFMRITDRYGNELDVARYRDKERVVMLVLHTSGIIDNGGFQYLFEGNLNGDPHYAKTAAAYNAVGAEKCAEAVAEALALFPDSKPPTDPKARLAAFQATNPAKRQAIDRKFFSDSKEIEKHVAKFVRENRADFLR